MTSNEKIVKKSFYELVEKKCITSSKIIEESQNCDYFQAIPPDKICYHPDMDKLDENSIKFSLLHEENHNRHKFQAIIPFIFINLIVLFLVFLHIITINCLNFFLYLIFVLILAIFFKRREEYKSDEFASSTLKKILNIQEPISGILEKTLEKMPYKSWLSILIHPSHKNRIKYLQKIDRTTSINHTLLKIYSQ